MTQQEFTNRTNVEVSDKEFEAINIVYEESDLQKDEFCKMWCKMNASRVKAARVNRMIREREEAYKDTLAQWFHGWLNGGKFYQNYDTPIAYCKLNIYEVRAMSFAGILLDDTLANIHHKVGVYLGVYGR